MTELDISNVFKAALLQTTGISLEGIGVSLALKAVEDAVRANCSLPAQSAIITIKLPNASFARYDLGKQKFLDPVYTDEVELNKIITKLGCELLEANKENRPLHTRIAELESDLQHEKEAHQSAVDTWNEQVAQLKAQLAEAQRRLEEKTDLLCRLQLPRDLHRSAFKAAQSAYVQHAGSVSNAALDYALNEYEKHRTAEAPRVIPRIPAHPAPTGERVWLSLESAAEYVAELEAKVAEAQKPRVFTWDEVRAVYQASLLGDEGEDDGDLTPLKRHLESLALPAPAVAPASAPVASQVGPHELHHRICERLELCTHAEQALADDVLKAASQERPPQGQWTQGDYDNAWDGFKFRGRCDEQDGIRDALDAVRYRLSAGSVEPLSALQREALEVCVQHYQDNEDEECAHAIGEVLARFPAPAPAKEAARSEGAVGEGLSMPNVPRVYDVIGNRPHGPQATLRDVVAILQSEFPGHWMSPAGRAAVESRIVELAPEGVEVRWAFGPQGNVRVWDAADERAGEMVERIRRAWSRVAPAPWRVEEARRRTDYVIDSVLAADNTEVVAPHDDCVRVDRASVTAIAQAPEHIAILLAEIDRLRERS